MTGDAGAQRVFSGAWYLTFVVFLAYLVGQIDRQVMVMLAGEMKATLAFSDEQLGLLLGLAFSATYAVGAILFAQLAQVRGRRTVLLFGIILWSAATAVCALVKSFEGLLVARLFVGLGEGALAPAALPMISSAFPPERRSFPLALCMSGASVGLIVAPMATGWILSVMAGKEFGPFPGIGIVYGWQTAFLIAGAVGFLVVLLLLTLREPRDPDAQSNGSHRFIDAYAHFVKHAKFYLGIFAAAPIAVAPGFALIAWVPIYLQRTFGMSAMEVGTQFAAAFLPAVIAAPFITGGLAQFAARTVNQRGYFNLLISLVVFGSLAMALPMLMPTATSTLIVFSIAILLQNVIMAVGMISSQQLVNSVYRGHATAILMAVQMVIGGGFGPFAVGVFATRIVGEDALHLALIMLVVITFPVGILVLSLARRAQSKLRGGQADGDQTVEGESTGDGAARVA